MITKLRAIIRPQFPTLFFRLATGAEAAKSDLEKLHLLARGQRANLHRPDQITFDVLDPATSTADEMMMMIRVWIESDAARLEDLFNHPLLLQPIERVVNGRARSHWEFAVDRLQNLIGRRVMIRRLHIINNCAPLRRHLQPARLRHHFDYLPEQPRHRKLD
jgi:hypothetical protein